MSAVAGSLRLRLPELAFYLEVSKTQLEAIMILKLLSEAYLHSVFRSLHLKSQIPIHRLVRIITEMAGLGTWRHMYLLI